MDRVEIEKNVVEILKAQLGSGEIKSDEALVNDLGCDELDIVELTMALEEEFDFEITDEDMEKLVTVKDIVDYIENKKK